MYIYIIMSHDYYSILLIQFIFNNLYLPIFYMWIMIIIKCSNKNYFLYPSIVQYVDACMMYDNLVQLNR